MKSSLSYVQLVYGLYTVFTAISFEVTSSILQRNPGSEIHVYICTRALHTCHQCNDVITKQQNYSHLKNS